MSHTRLPTNAKWHGTAGGYTNHRCRCIDCRNAWRLYHGEGGYQDRYRDKFRGEVCRIAGCTRLVALSNPSEGICHHHLFPERYKGAA